LIGFTEHITEAFKAKSAKNVHLEHLEDEILNDGYRGFTRAVSAIRGVLDVFAANEPSAYDITVKWDGAPAIVCGIDPASGRFFVGTKSVFNVTPKLNFTDADIDANHPNDGLNTKLKLALKHFSKLGIRGVLQGDLLFDKDTVIREKIDGSTYLTFRANTITYAVDPKSELGKRVVGAKIGIVFHTAYEGDSISTMTARFNPDISYLKKSRDVWFDNATLRVANGAAMFSPTEREEVERSISALTQTAAALKTTMNGISRNEGVKIAIKTYINGLVRSNMVSGHADVNQLLAMMAQKAQTARKKPSTKPTPSMDWIKANRNQINRVFALHNGLTTLKLSVINKLSSLKSGVGTFVKDGKGYRVTAPEGYVAIDRMSNKAVKLVDRLDFSRSNFNIEKTWGKK
jgi:hypothetical protein